MEVDTIQNLAKEKILGLKESYIDIVEINKPKTLDEAVELSKVISKLSPIVGNNLEFYIVDALNKYGEMKKIGRWERQDPGFPDAIFITDAISESIGFEIKAWYPFSTEITGRFKSSTNLLKDNSFDLALIVWLPEYVFWGKPKIIDIGLFDCESVANARNTHYHNPPEYLVKEPENTENRTENLQQRNTEGYVIQAVKNEKQVLVKKGEIYMQDIDMGVEYDVSKNYQDKIKKLMSQIDYRLDTNYAKINRINHTDINKFKQHILEYVYNGRTINQWIRIQKEGNEKELKECLGSLL